MECLCPVTQQDSLQLLVLQTVVPPTKETRRNSNEVTIKEGVSSRKGKAGLGLSHIRRFARVNQGTLTVISGNGKVNFYSKSIEPRPMPSKFHGTAIELRINADKGGFYFLTSEKDFIF